MKHHYQLVIIGGGPAGLAAATTAANQGISCALLDEQTSLGGQVYRAIESIPEQREQHLGSEYLRGKPLVSEFRASDAKYYPETKVWSLNKQREIGVLYKDQARIISADQVIVASGAMERPVPFPGWTLPGVMQAGAGQILFKSAGVVPDNGVVIAGSGPLMLLLARQYLHAGVQVKALLDMTPFSNYLTAMPKLPKALLAHQYLSKGVSYQLELKQAGVPQLFGVSELRAEGSEALQNVCFKHFGKQKTIESELLLTHFGVIPNTWLTQAADVDHKWDGSQQCWRPEHDQWGNTNVTGIIVAGDGAGIYGARSAEYAGRLAGLQALYALGAISQTERDQQAIKERKRMNADRHIRPFLEAYFKIPAQLMATPDNKTIICRCEEVTAGDIRQAVEQGHDNSNQVKFFTRCGMGACQGRQCSQAVAHIVADAKGESVEKVGHFRGRPPVSPLSLTQLANLQKGESV